MSARPESTPISRTLMRGTAGVGDGLADAEADGSPEGSRGRTSLGVTSKSGSSEATGGTVPSGTHALPSSTGANTSVAASRASIVSEATTSCGPTMIAIEATSAARVAARRPDRRDEPDGPEREQAPRSRLDWRTSRIPRTVGSNRRAASEVALEPSERDDDRSDQGEERERQHERPQRRPATRCPRPGTIAVSSRSRGAADRGGGLGGRDGHRRQVCRAGRKPASPRSGRVAPRRPTGLAVRRVRRPAGCATIPPCEPGFLQVPNLLPRPRLRTRPGSLPGALEEPEGIEPDVILVRRRSLAEHGAAARGGPRVARAGVRLPPPRHRGRGVAQPAPQAGRLRRLPVHRSALPGVRQGAGPPAHGRGRHLRRARLPDHPAGPEPAAARRDVRALPRPRGRSGGRSSRRAPGTSCTRSSTPASTRRSRCCGGWATSSTGSTTRSSRAGPTRSSATCPTSSRRSSTSGGSSGPMRAVLRDLERTKQRYLAEDLDIYFDDITDAAERIWDVLENYKEVAEALEGTNESVLSHRLNANLSLLTALSVLLLPATLVASVWGMNVELPGDESLGEFWLLVVVMAGVDGRLPRSTCAAAGGCSDRAGPARGHRRGRRRRRTASHRPTSRRRSTGSMLVTVLLAAQSGRGPRRRRGSGCTWSSASSRSGSPHIWATLVGMRLARADDARDRRSRRRARRARCWARPWRR